MIDKQYWFKRRRYGWGWIPVSWKGWIALAVYLIVVLSSVLIVKDVPDNTYQAEVGVFLLVVFISTTLFLLVAYKNSPAPKWRWGKKPSDNPEEDF